ncbi:hypothetical protein C482_11495 [Natrialba chahannaoensis JCM 10990]|uniref:Uncharacterized protein n=1 Tax=Natrialba chahannaoensis JCM 10990 TaxID=1227492 RepID=M0AJI7_9EURY|nr:hypothetical protein [Natrialba chahannaoensis]ELY98699.1 hypothetical protein C482_11495 [Natrialba chahannaoensis JCM 10990]
MTSLTEAYQGNAREVTSLRRLYAGTALVLLGATLAVVAVLVATTDFFADLAIGLSEWGMDDQYAVVRVAGVLAGIGVPAALVGVFIVLPASRRVRAAAAISASLCLLGVVLFWHAYPQRWRFGSDQLTLEISAIYLLGLFIALWCLFVAVVNFKTRNDPGGMLEMNVTRHNQTVVEVDESTDTGGFGGIGFLGGTPDGDVETQTNASSGDDTDDENTTVSGRQPDAATGDSTFSYSESQSTTSRTQSKSQSNASRSGLGGRSAVTSDGGSTTQDISSPLESQPVGDGRDAEIVTDASDADEPPTEPTDRYCGNCRHFEYVRSSSGMVPYCGRHEQAMDDMDACEEWTPNRR